MNFAKHHLTIKLIVLFLVITNFCFGQKRERVVSPNVGRILISVNLVTPAFDSEGKFVKIEKEEVLEDISLVIDRSINQDSILAKSFKHFFKPKQYFRLKIENQTDNEWTIYIHNKSFDNKCVTVVPSSDYTTIKSKEIQPKETIESSVFVISDNSGIENFVILATQNRSKLLNLFTTVDFLTSVSRANQPINLSDLEEVDASELKQSISKGKGDLGARKIAITLGNVYSSSGQALKPVEFYDALLQIGSCFSTKSNSSEENTSFNKTALGWLNNRGMANYLKGNLGLAKTDYEESLNRIKEARKSNLNSLLLEESIVLTNLAQVYATLGDQKEAIKQYIQALEILKNEVGEPFEVRSNRYSAIYNGLGTSNEFIGELALAEKFYKEALDIERENKQTASEGITLNSLARLMVAKDDFSQAEVLFKQALQLSKLTQNQAGIASAYNNLGLLYVKQNKSRAAIQLFIDAAKILHQINNRSALATILSNLMFVEQKQKLSSSAIFYGKQSVNILQEMRSEISGIDKELQRSFLLTREETYRKLADILIANGRIAEAEEVLAMLKEEEFFAYLRR